MCELDRGATGTSAQQYSAAEVCREREATRSACQRPAAAAGTTTCPQAAVDVTRARCSNQPRGQYSPFRRSVYSRCSAALAPHPAAAAASRCEADSQAVAVTDGGRVQRDQSADDRCLTDAVTQCRQHIDDISREAGNMEQLLNQLASTSPEREHVLDAVQRLDSLRRHINSTQQLLSNVDSMIHTRHQTESLDRDAAGSKTQLLQQELGRLSSRLCCTVVGLERAMNKAISQGTHGALITTTLSAADYCTPAGQNVRPTDPVLGDPVITVHQQQSVASQGTGGICEKWLNSQPLAGSNIDVTIETWVAAAESTQSNKEQVSLEDIHRMLGNIISDIDQPASASGMLRVQPAVSPGHSHPSVMTDSNSASTNENFLPAQSSAMVYSPRQSPHQSSATIQSPHGRHDDEQSATKDEVWLPQDAERQVNAEDIDCQQESNWMYCNDSDTQYQQQQLSSQQQ